MSNRLVWIAIGCLPLTALVLFLLNRTSDMQESTNPTITQSSNKPKSISFSDKQSNIIELPTFTQSDQLNSPELTIENDLSVIEMSLSFYRGAFGTNPIGLNNEITAALIGKNPKRIAALPADHSAISKNNELLDRWGTPFRFHAISGTQMTIRSAGPDRQFYTADDHTSDDL